MINLMESIDLAWQHCLTQLEQQYSPEQFNTWIASLTAVRFDAVQAVFVVAAPNRFKLDWVKRNIFNELALNLSNYLQLPTLRVELIVDSKALLKKQNLIASGVQSQHDNAEQVADVLARERSRIADQNDLMVSDPASVRLAKPTRGQINAEFTFDNFVMGRANMLARGAAEQVAHQLGQSYNPFFVYGGVGLGKTHLIQAIGNAVLQQNSKARVCYVHAEKYVSDLVKAYQRKTFDDFKRYYHSLDLLLIDDIQFFAGKQRTQEEFFYAFEALIASRSQIVMTCDTYPKELSKIDERLISRFGSGLTVAIEPPELEMRVAILLKKAAQMQAHIPEDVAFFMAKNVRSNVRELEGQLYKVLAFSKFCHRPIDLVLTKEALKDFLSVQNRAINVESIQKTVADYYNIKVSDMHSKKRPANIAKPRQIAMYLAKELTQKSLPEIGELFGKRDHTTVLHAVRKISQERAHDEQLNHQLHVLEQTIKS